MPRGRPPAFDREQVLQKLLFLFWEKGYEATSQSDMVERAGISSSSLYNTFGNKPDIYDAALAHYNGMSYDALSFLRDGEAGIDDIVAFLDMLIGFMKSDAMPAGCLMVRTMTELDGRTDGPATSERTSTYRNQITTALRMALQRAAERGEIGGDEIAAKASLILSMYLGALAVAISSRETGAEMFKHGQAMVASWKPV
ncbi:MAG: TetR/AcrR family transcriptional regulator [Rhodothermales bacterium]